MVDFSDSRKLVDELLTKAKEVVKGKSLAEAGIDVKWVRCYGVISRRCRDDKDFGITSYPYEQGHGVSVPGKKFCYFYKDFKPVGFVVASSNPHTQVDV